MDAYEAIEKAVMKPMLIPAGGSNGRFAPTWVSQYPQMQESEGNAHAVRPEPLVRGRPLTACAPASLLRRRPFADLALALAQ
jgi:hypothetical protein